MNWQSQATCSACAFVSGQLGFRAPCPFHVGRWSDCLSEADPAEPPTFDTPRPTADRPWPFTPREYGRLLLLRNRVGDQLTDRRVTLAPDGAARDREALP
jgi:hypothetical protein